MAVEFIIVPSGSDDNKTCRAHVVKGTFLTQFTELLADGEKGLTWPPFHASFDAKSRGIFA